MGVRVGHNLGQIVPKWDKFANFLGQVFSISFWLSDKINLRFFPFPIWHILWPSLASLKVVQWSIRHKYEHATKLKLSMWPSCLENDKSWISRIGDLFENIYLLIHFVSARSQKKTQICQVLKKDWVIRRCVTRDTRFASKVGQIDPKLDKSGI